MTVRAVDDQNGSRRPPRRLFAADQDRPRSRAGPASRDQSNRSDWFCWRPPLERVVQRLRYEGVHADDPRGRLTTHLHCEPVFKGNRRSHN